KAPATPLIARKRVKKTEPIKIIKILTVAMAVLVNASLSAAQVKVLRMAAKTKDTNAPIAPASVGEKIPTKIPPRMANIRTGNGHISLSAALFSLAVGRSLTEPASLGFTL